MRLLGDLARRGSCTRCKDVAQADGIHNMFFAQSAKKGSKLGLENNDALLGFDNNEEDEDTDDQKPTVSKESDKDDTKKETGQVVSLDNFRK